MRGSIWLGVLCAAALAAIAGGEDNLDGSDGDGTSGGRGGAQGGSQSGGGKSGCGNGSATAGDGGTHSCVPLSGGEGGAETAGVAGRGGAAEQGGADGRGGAPQQGAAGDGGDGGVGGAGVAGSGGLVGEGGAKGEDGGAGQGGVDGSSGAPAHGGEGGAPGSDDGAGGDGGEEDVFVLTSPNHAEGAEFADKYTCAEAGFLGSLLPELSWTSGPAGTLSYAITFINVTLAEDPVASTGAYQWAIYDIPASTLGLPEAFTNAASIGATQLSAAPNNAYLGPCPLGFEYEYEFVIYALPIATVSVAGTGSLGVKNAKAAFEAAQPLAIASLTGTSHAMPP